jgi:hypothetical protein
MSATNSSSAAFDGKTPVSVLADNLMRRVLRITDPRNPKEVAQGLGRAYPTESAELDEEIQGLPIGLPAPALILNGTPPSIASRELVQAQSNIQRDLDFLTGSSQLKEVQVELLGWGETIRTWLADGAAAAPQALDAAARDRVFSARRYLLDYAWVSRLVGGQTPGLSIAYRRFARSLDEAAGLLLVSAGEALSQNNYSGDRLLLQAPASELSARADAASAALSNLAGSVQNAFSPTAWPWGLDSYRKLLERLENAGHGDIRVLLQENGLRTFTDELVDRASDVTGDGLRGLAATHVVALERVRRLITIGSEFSRESPPLAAFLSALQLFVDTFRGGTAIRLISLGRPLLSSAGLYTFGGPDPGTQTLQNLVEYRSIVSQLNDILFGTDLTLLDAEAQFVVDSCLYSIDLAIDLYAVGVNPEGQGVIEQRAAAYGVLVWELLGNPNGPLALLNPTGGPRARPLLPPLPPGPSWPPSFGVPSVGLLISTLINTVNALGLSGLPRQILTTIPNISVPTTGTVGTPSLSLTTPNRDLRAMAQELAIVEGRHSGLLPLVDALTPGNYDPDQILASVRSAVKSAQTLVGGPDRSRIDVPPPVETTLVHGIKTIAPPGVPKVTSMNRTSGPATGNTPVVISGTGFTGASSVEFGAGNAATDVRVHNDTTISATSPAGTGEVNVLVTTHHGQSPISQTFVYVPQVAGLSPSVGSTAGGTLVRVTGQGFTGVSSLQFGPGAAAAAAFSFVSDTLIIAGSPPAAGTGMVDVQVTILTTSGPETSPVVQPADQFTYIEPPGQPDMAPVTGPSAGGTLVTITGTGLTGATAVRFGRNFGTQLNVISDREILVMSPPGPTSGSLKVSVHVVTPAGELTASSQFVYD